MMCVSLTSSFDLVDQLQIRQGECIFAVLIGLIACHCGGDHTFHSGSRCSATVRS